MSVADATAFANVYGTHSAVLSALAANSRAIVENARARQIDGISTGGADWNRFQNLLLLQHDLPSPLVLASRTSRCARGSQLVRGARAERQRHHLGAVHEERRQA